MGAFLGVAWLGGTAACSTVAAGDSLCDKTGGRIFLGMMFGSAPVMLLMLFGGLCVWWLRIRHDLKKTRKQCIEVCGLLCASVGLLGCVLLPFAIIKQYSQHISPIVYTYPVDADGRIREHLDQKLKGDLVEQERACHVYFGNPCQQDGALLLFALVALALCITVIAAAVVDFRDRLQQADRDLEYARR